MDATLPDGDGDGHGDPLDNCRNAANPGQQDDGDRVGGACDPDEDVPDVPLAICDDEVQENVARLYACLFSNGFEDSDGDDEHDPGDHCPNTPARAPVDDSGCSLEQFGTAQDDAVCEAADWRNDKPRGKPGDCGRVGTKRRGYTCQVGGNGRMRRRLIALFAALLVASAASGYELHTLELPVNDLEFDPVSGLVYASVPAFGPLGNNVVALDPLTRSVVRSAFVGSSPNRIAISDDGSSLYVGLDGSHNMRRVSLPDLVPGPLIAFSTTEHHGPFSAEDIDVQPGNADVIAVSVQSFVGSRGVRIFDGGVQRAAIVEERLNQIEFTEDPGTLWAYNNETTGFDLMRISVDGGGATIDKEIKGLVNSFLVELLYEGGLIYDSFGGLCDPFVPKTLGYYLSPLPSLGRGIAVDVARNRVYLLIRDRLEVFDRARFVKLGEIPIPGNEFDVGALTRWGDDRLVFATSSGR